MFMLIPAADYDGDVYTRKPIRLLKYKQYLSDGAIPAPGRGAYT